MAHADVFELGAMQKFLFVLFGGSGIGKEGYEARSRSIVPIFEPLLQEFDRRSMEFVMVYVTSPYDVPYNRFVSEPEALAAWNKHITTELLESWNSLPMFISGFSGGAALAFNGLEKEPRCFGGGTFGGDQIPLSFARPKHWPVKLRLYSTPNDWVSKHPANRNIAERLVAGGHAELIQLRTGKHSLSNYCTMDGLGALIRIADEQAQALNQG